MELWRRRCQHTWLITCYLFYLQLLTRSITGLICRQSGEGTYLLIADLTTQCWVGEHSASAAFMVLLIIGLGFCFPLSVFIRILRVRSFVLGSAHSESLLQLPSERDSACLPSMHRWYPILLFPLLTASSSSFVPSLLRRSRETFGFFLSSFKASLSLLALFQFPYSCSISYRNFRYNC